MTHKEKDSCKGNISAKECLHALNVMGDGKIPEMDGLTVELYNIFSVRTQPLFSAGNFLYNIVDHSEKRAYNFPIPKPNRTTFTVKKMSITQKSALITSLYLNRTGQHFL